MNDMVDRGDAGIAAADGYCLKELRILMTSPVRYLPYKDLLESVRAMYQRGGQFQKAANSVDAILGRIQRKEKDPFSGFHPTRHGESRIQHCVKYDLNAYSRLITIQDNSLCALCYIGNHDESEQWLDRNKGLTLTVNAANELQPVRTSRNIAQPDLRIASTTNWDTGKLVSRLPARYYDRIADGIARSLLMKFEALESVNTEDQVLELACCIEPKGKQNVFFDVFCKLRSGDVAGAKHSIDLFTSALLRVEALTSDQIEQVIEGDAFADPEVVSELLAHFMKTADYRDWMLFMGREQKEVVNKNYSGPAKLAGVSGSGKTCVVVKRAIRLAQAYPGEQILILTINPALARLITQLVDYAAPATARSTISINSFWQLCQAELRKFEPEKFERYYTDVTWKRKEHISEIWDEYYDPWMQREFHNRDASIMLPIHRELLTRGVFPKTYIAQEFDWVRSALDPSRRSEYLGILRKGRHAPIDEGDRRRVLGGLDGWERKMKFVGVIDDVGLAIALHHHLDKIKPAYRCVLVDEAQDFGTLELRIVRCLAEERENDLFLCGDIAQRISTKHHSLPASGIDATGRSKSLKRNYRNSRQVLAAAYDVLKRNMSPDAIQDDDFEAIDPEYADFSSAKPLLLDAELQDLEMAYALAYLRGKYQEGRSGNGPKACIAVAGLSFVEVRRHGATLGLPVLDGSTSLMDSTVFLADLAQMKGYEFDTVCILNCSAGIIPDPCQPPAESYRDLSKLYVAMTRAKQELILSFTGQPTQFLAGSKDFLNKAQWKEYAEPDLKGRIDISPHYKAPESSDALELTGEDFLYTRHAVGLSRRLQDQLLSTVTGMTSMTDGRQTEWPTIRALLEHSTTGLPAVARAFGAKSFNEFVEWLRERGLL